LKQWRLRGVTAEGPDPDPTPAPLSRGDSIRMLVDQFPGLFWTTDAGLRVTSSLGKALSLTGLAPIQVMGRAVDEVLGTDDPGAVLLAHRRALTGEAVVLDLSLGGRTFRARLAPLTEAHGRSIGVIGVALESPPEPEPPAPPRSAVALVAG